MYRDDSFFTLSFAGQVGLLIVSLLLAGITVLGLISLCRTATWPVRLALALIVYSAFIWLAPQFYYFYYIFLFKVLPWQIVVATPPSPADLFDLLFFQNRHNLSFHAQGLFGWLMIAVGLFWGRRQARSISG